MVVHNKKIPIISLLINKVLNKKFKDSYEGGYQTEDVDRFLDELVTEINQLLDAQKKIFDENENLKNELSTLKSDNHLMLQNLNSLKKQMQTYKEQGYEYLSLLKISSEKNKKINKK